MFCRYKYYFVINGTEREFGVYEGTIDDFKRIWQTIRNRASSCWVKIKKAPKESWQRSTLWYYTKTQGWQLIRSEE